MNEKIDLEDAVAGAWRAFEHAATLQVRVNPSLPVLFFGNLHAYSNSTIRILTVGKNPSFHEFPKASPYQRFPHAEGVTINEQDCFLDALSTYFSNCPYWKWFRPFELMLSGLDASYREGNHSTALHTDICSPVATCPTWTSLKREEQNALIKDGVPLWHHLLKVLQPQIVVLSLARSHLSRIEFKAMTQWKAVREVEQEDFGEFGSRSVKVCARWCEINSEPSLLVFVPAKRLPLGPLSDCLKREAGVIALDEFHRGV